MRYFAPDNREITREEALYLYPNTFKSTYFGKEDREIQREKVKMYDVMIDIETMGTHTSRSLILSVGIVAFAITEERPVFAEKNMLEVLTLEPQILNGRLIEKGTQDWWAKQTPAARQHWENAGDKITPAALRFRISEYLQEYANGVSTLVWANGIVFDLGNLENLFAEYDANPPWKYNVTRDARTIYNMLPQLRTMPTELKFEGHDPIQDCYKQIWRLWEKWPSFATVLDGK